jgi:hypothetical protein
MGKELQNKPTVLEILRDSWFLVLFSIGVIIASVKVQAAVDEQSDKIQKVETRIDGHDVSIHNIDVNTQKIMTTLEFIKERVK